MKIFRGGINKGEYMDELVRKLLALYKSGKTLRAIGKITKMSHEMVRQLLMPTGAVKRIKIDIGELKKTYDKCKSLTETGKKFDMSPQHVWNVLKGNIYKKKEKKTEKKRITKRERVIVRERV